MRGVLLVNMGGPQSLASTRQFLWRMFTDKHILPMAKPLRYLLAAVITLLRHRKSWAKYQLIGGSPLNSSSQKLASKLSGRLATSEVRLAYSYTNPLISKQIAMFVKNGITDISILPLYPHYSITTTQSVFDDAKAAACKYGANIIYTKPYYANDSYIDFWAKQINQHIAKCNYQQSMLVFSGHSIPNSFVERQDPYPQQIEKSAKLIAQAVNCHYRLAYQSQVGRNWLGPITDELINQLANQGHKQLIIVPISFVNENLETLYDIDRIMLPKAIQRHSDLQISRIAIPQADSLFVDALVSALD